MRPTATTNRQYKQRSRVGSKDDETQTQRKLSMKIMGHKTEL